MADEKQPEAQNVNPDEKTPADGAQEGEKKKVTLTEKMKSTVKQRKKPKKANTQRYVPISEIRNDTVILKNGGLRAILSIEPLNFNLKSETEQEGIIAGYQSFINTLSFPVQVVIRSTKVNIAPYIEQIREQARDQQNELLRDQTVSYALFIERLVDVADIMQKRFYLVVPQDDRPAKQSTLSQFLDWMNIDDSAAKISQRNRRFHQRSILLRDRMNLVESGLHNVGLISRRLTTRELIELYYEMYNPRTSQQQKLPKELNTEELIL